MTQQSNFYRIYQLAYSDRTQALKSLILFAVLLSLFSIASLLFLGGINTNNYKFIIISTGLWFIGFSLLPLFFLAAPKSQIFLGDVLFVISFFAPLILIKLYNLYLLYIALSTVTLLIISTFRFKGEADTLINLDLAKLMPKVSFLFTLILFIIIGTLIYYDRPNISLLSDRTQLETALTNYLNKTSFNNISFNGTIDDTLTKYINQQIVPTGINNKTINQLILSQTRETVSRMLDISLTGKETLWETIKKYFVTHWSNFSLSIKILIIAVIVSTGFSVIAFVSSIFNIILVILSWILLKLLILVKYFKIKMIGVEKEELSLV